MMVEELHKYEFVESLGEGAYGQVFKAIHKSSRMVVAIKIIRSKVISRQLLVDLAKKSKEIKHHNVVDVVHYFHSSKGFCTVTEYAPQGNLSDLLKKEGGLSKEKTQKYLVQLVGALGFLHFKGIVHGDLKPQNILIYDGDVIKICDFGLAPLIWETNINLQINTGTLQYMAPEVLQMSIYHTDADYWSLGIVLYQLLGGSFPKSIQDGSVGVQKWHMTVPLLHYPLNTSPDFKSFIERLLSKNPAERRLEWPKFDSPLFVSEARRDVDARELQGNTAEGRVCDVSLDMYMTGLTLTSARPEGVLPLDRYLESSGTFHGSMSISQNEQILSAVLQPLKDEFNDHSVEDVINLNISLKIISNIVDYNAINSKRAVEMFWALKNFTIYLVDLRKSDDLVEKCFIVVTKVMRNYKGWFGDLHKSHCIGIMDIFIKVAGCTETASGKVLHESIGFIIVIASEVAQDDLKEILDYAKEKGVVNSLLSCVILVSVSLDFFPIACEAFKAISSLLTADGDECKKIIAAVTKAFLQSDKAVEYAFYTCLRHSSEEDVWKCVLQIILRCCRYDNSVSSLLCGLPNSSPVSEITSGGGDSTIVSEIFFRLSWYARLPRPDDVISDLCFVLATIAQSLKSIGRNYAELILTSSSKKQKSRLSNLAYHLYRIRSSPAPSANAMLALASVFSLESSNTSSISIIGLPLIPVSSKLCENLRMVLTKDDSWQACLDGTVGLLDATLRWGGESAIQQFCDRGVLETLIDLVGGNIDSSDNRTGLSPVGVVWILSLLNHCLGYCGVTKFTMKYVELMSALLSDVHLELIKLFGGEKNDVGKLVDAITDLLESPLATLEGAFGQEQKKDRILESIMRKYIGILVMVGLPGQVVKVLEHVELEDAARPVAFLARVTRHQSVIDQILDEDLFHPVTMKRLLGPSSPREVTLNILKIISDIVTIDEVYYEQIERANILPSLKNFLAYEDPKMRIQACRTISKMCLHSDYFYGSFQKHKIVPLLVDCYADQDRDTRYNAGSALAAAAFQSNALHKEVWRCIPQITKSLLSVEEETRSKFIACYILSYLVEESGRFGDDIILEGAMKALLILVSEYSSKSCNHCEEKLLHKCLETLEHLRQHAACLRFIQSFVYYPGH